MVRADAAERAARWLDDLARSLWPAPAAAPRNDKAGPIPAIGEQA
jgi:hypothetical protein